MTQKTKIHHIILLDRSGSMISIAEQARTGFNEVIQQIKEDAENYEDTQEHTASLVVFNGNVEKIFWLEDINNLEQLNERTYRPMGSTSLRDAIGITISDLETDLKSEIGSGKSKIFMTVITDGEDTSSREYSNKGIEEAIKNLKQEEESSPWTLTLVGANIDAVTTGKHFGMAAGMSQQFSPDANGTKMAFNSVAATRGAYSKGVARGLSKSLTDGLVSYSSALGRNPTDEEVDEFLTQTQTSSEVSEDQNK